MFFHSRREQEAAEVFGVTDPFGVTLLNRDHPFPLLVEEEEKLHGALLANTTHGALYRALGSMQPRQQGGIMDQLYGLILPKADGFGLDPVKVYDRICFAKDRVLGKALPVHEAFAKYCAFTLQYTALNGASTQTLDALWEDECRRYDWLGRLADAIGEPAAARLYKPTYRTAYATAKAVLNIGDLDRLLSISDPIELYGMLKGNLTMEPFDDRMEIALSVIKIHQIEADHVPTILRNLKDAGMHAHEGLDAATVSARAVLLGKRFELLSSRALSCNLEDRHLAWKMGTWIELDGRVLHPDGALKTVATAQSIGGVLASDPSLNVSYDAYSKGSEWPDGRLMDEPLEDAIEAVVYLADGGSGSIDCYAILDLPGNEQPTMLFEDGNDWISVEEQLSRIDKSKLAIVMLPASFQQPSINVPPTEILAEALEYLGSVVYWNTTSTPSDVVDMEAFLYTQGGIPTPDAGLRGPAGVLSRHRGAAVAGAAPLYAVDLVSGVLGRIPSHGFGLYPPPRLITASVMNIGQAVTDVDARPVPPEIVAAARVYEHFYRFGNLPGPLPFYDPMALFETIYDVIKEAP